MQVHHHTIHTTTSTHHAVITHSPRHLRCPSAAVHRRCTLPAFLPPPRGGEWSLQWPRQGHHRRGAQWCRLFCHRRRWIPWVHCLHISLCCQCVQWPCDSVNTAHILYTHIVHTYCTQTTFHLILYFTFTRPPHPHGLPHINRSQPSPHTTHTLFTQHHPNRDIKLLHG